MQWPCPCACDTKCSFWEANIITPAVHLWWRRVPTYSMFYSPLVSIYIDVLLFMLSAYCTAWNFNVSLTVHSLLIANMWQVNISAFVCAHAHAYTHTYPTYARIYAHIPHMRACAHICARTSTGDSQTPILLYSIYSWYYSCKECKNVFLQKKF